MTATYKFPSLVVGLGQDLGHVGAVRDVLVVAEDVDGVLAGGRRHVIHLGRPVPVVLAVDLSLAK